MLHPDSSACTGGLDLVLVLHRLHDQLHYDLDCLLNDNALLDGHAQEDNSFWQLYNIREGSVAAVHRVHGRICREDSDYHDPHGRARLALLCLRLHVRREPLLRRLCSNLLYASLSQPAVAIKHGLE